MTATIPFSQGTFRLLDIHVSEVENYPGALQDMMFNRRYEGMIIREVFPKDVMEQVAAGIEKYGSDFDSIFVSEEKTGVAHEKGPNFYGWVLAALKKPKDIEEYFAHEPVLRQIYRTLFPANQDYYERMESVFRALAGGKPVKTPTGLEGQNYCASNLRMIPVGHELRLHVGNDFIKMPQASYLNNLFDLTDQLSFFIPIVTAEAGGKLKIYSLELNEEMDKQRREGFAKMADLSDAELYDAYSSVLAELPLDQYESLDLSPDAGDMLLFDGGRYFHQVTRVEGRRTRITTGGFLNFSHEHDTVYYWT